VKIGETSNQFPDFPQQKKVRERGKTTLPGGPGPVDPEATDFMGAILEAAGTEIQADLDQLMNAVQAQGERLARTQTFEELGRYKDLVRSFLMKVSKDLYKLQISDAGDPRKGQKVYVILQKVDAELENLTKMVLAGQVPQLKILAKLDQIRGLLLDSYK
jgi:uncharacterized protein YaaR (DUF327 family)